MGHLLFCILHFLALLFGVMGLVITIPLHLIYTVISGSSSTFGNIMGNIETNLNMRDCPFCTKKIMKAATRCPYCQAEVDSVEITPEEHKKADIQKALCYLGLVAVVVFVLSIIDKMIP